MPPKFVFVPSRGFDKPYNSERKMIRSHCMKDRNRKQPKPPRRAPPPLLPLGEESEEVSSSESEKTLALVTKSASPNNSRQIVIPDPPPLGLYFMSFPSEVSSRSKNLLFKYYEVTSSTLYIDSLNQSLRRSKVAWQEWFSIDIAFMHAVLGVVSGIDDFIRRQPISRQTYLHLRMSIQLLNQQLAGAKAALTDSTVAVVVMLGYLALGMGEIGEARAHLAGLQQMLQLRGGLGNFVMNQKLAAKVCHLDICFYLMTGEMPRFLFPSPSGFQPPGIGRFLNNSGDHSFGFSVDSIASPRMARLFQELQMLTELINAVSIYKPSSSEDASVHGMFYSIHYELIYLHGILEDTNDELLRLAMLAFMATTYRIPGGSFMSTPNLRLWLLLIGAMLLFDVEEPWLRELWQAEIPQLSWRDAKQRLQEILWINAIHDELGRKAFDNLNKPRLH